MLVAWRKSFSTLPLRSNIFVRCCRPMRPVAADPSLASIGSSRASGYFESLLPFERALCDAPDALAVFRQRKWRTTHEVPG
jgi:hypothetical protein